MTYTYKVTLEINRFDLNDANIHEREIKTNEFRHENPLIARNAAFTRALSYDDILLDSMESTEIFFKDSKDWYKEFNITVVFVDPYTQKDILLHETLSIDKNTRMYDEIMFRRILDSLGTEYKIFEKNAIDVSESKNIEINFQPSGEIIKVKVFLTPFIQEEKMTIQEILL